MKSIEDTLYIIQVKKLKNKTFESFNKNQDYITENSLLVNGVLFTIASSH